MTKSLVVIEQIPGDPSRATMHVMGVDLKDIQWHLAEGLPKVDTG